MTVLFDDALAQDLASEWTQLVNPSQLLRDTSYTFRSDVPASFRWIGSATASYGQVSTNQAVYVSRFYVKFDSFPTASTGLVQSQGTSSAFSIRVATAAHPIVAIGTTNRTDTGFTFVAGTKYRIDCRFDASGTTWKLDYQISNGTSEALLFTGAQLTLAGQVAEVLTAYRLGQNGAGATEAFSGNAQDLKITNIAGDYPLGQYVSSPVVAAVRAPYPWLPRSGCLLGTAANMTTDVVSNLALREAQVGRSFPIVNTYRGWNFLNTPMIKEQAVCASGHMLMMSAGGDPVPFPGMITGVGAGSYDNDGTINISPFLDLLIALPTPVILLRWVYEMNSSSGSWRNDPANYRAGFHHVHALIAAKGAANRIKMVYCPQMASSNALYGWADYEPDIDKYDVWGIDAYGVQYHQSTLIGTPFNAGAHPGDNWYQMGLARGKPMMVCETGARELNDPHHDALQTFTKAEWYTQWLADAPTLPGIKAWIVFDQAAALGNWRIDTTPTTAVDGLYDATTGNTTFAAFNTLAHDSYFNPPLQSMHVYNPLRGRQAVLAA